MSGGSDFIHTFQQSLWLLFFEIFLILYPIPWLQLGLALSHGVIMGHTVYKSWHEAIGHDGFICIYTY